MRSITICPGLWIPNHFRMLELVLNYLEIDNIMGTSIESFDDTALDRVKNKEQYVLSGISRTHQHSENMKK